MTTLAGEVSDQALEDFCREFEQRVLGRRMRFVSLVDTTRMTSAPTARQRRALADWQIATQEVGNMYNLGIAMVVSSALIRGAMTALNWLFPPTVRTETFADWGAASHYLSDVLARNDLAVESLPSRRQVRPHR